jgi:hypothetical protein
MRQARLVASKQQFKIVVSNPNERGNLEDLEVSVTILTYLITPWSRGLSEKLTRPQLVGKFSSFYATRRFITAFTRARQPSLS